MSEFTPAGSSGLGSRGFKALVCGILASLLVIGCTISPVVSTTEPTARYADCERAAEAYCEEVVEAGGRKLDRCVAEKRFECVARGSH